MRNDPTTLFLRVYRSLLGVTIGDALGMPYETLALRRILQITGDRPVLDMADAIQTRLADTAHLKAGMTTDDTQLTLAVAESLIRCHGFDLEDQARAHLEAYEASTFGWGGTTMEAMESLLAGRHPSIPMPPIPTKPGGRPKGRGNGVAMKIAPVAIWHALTQGRFSTEPLLTDTLALGRMTHPDIRASIAAYAIAVIVAKNIVGDFNGAGPNEILDFVRAEVRVAEARCQFLPGGNDPDTVSGRLEAMRTLMDDYATLVREVKPGFDALESIPFSIGIYLRRLDNIEAAISEAATAGGDTDTNASMVGAMSGSHYDRERSLLIPGRWTAQLADHGAAAQDCAERLVKAATAS